MNATPNVEQLVRVGILVSLTRTRADLLPVDEFGAVPDYFHDGDRRYRLHTKPNSPIAVYSLIDPTNEAKLTPALTELVAVADGLPNVSGEIDAQREKMQEAIDALLLANERQAVENHSLRQRAEEADKLREDRRERASRTVQNAVNREQQAAEKVNTAQAESAHYKDSYRMLLDANDTMRNRMQNIIEQAGKWKKRALAAELQAEQDHAEWQTISAEHARLADVERNLQDTQADLHDARAELQAARKNALDTITRITQQIPARTIDAEVEFPNVEIHRWFAVDNTPVVQIDTPNISGRIRVNLNDGVIWDGDPENDERPGKHAALLPHEIHAHDPAYTPEEREKIDDWNEHLASAHEQLRLQRLANGTLSEELDQLRAENNGLRADLRVNRAQGVTAQAEEIAQLHAQLDQAKRDREETARVADDEIHKQAEHFRAVIQQHVESAVNERRGIMNRIRKAVGLDPNDPRDPFVLIRRLRALNIHPAEDGPEIIAEANESIKQLRLELTERLTEIQNLQADLHIAREHAKNVVAKAGRDHAEHVVEIQKARGTIQLLKNQIAIRDNIEDIQRDTARTRGGRTLTDRFIKAVNPNSLPPFTTGP